MDTVLGLLISFFQMIFGNIFAFVAFYLLILLNIKLFGLWKLQLKNTDPVCPKCGNKSRRIKRDSLDKAINILSLYTLKWKKYTCYHCYWEGSRWD